MKFPAIFLLVALASCASLSRLGGVVEGTAYPTAGAAIGSAGGPLGAAAGAGVGHLVGQLATHEDVVIVDGETYQKVFVRQTALEWAMENWLWLVAVGFILHRFPWLPGYIRDQFRKRKEKKDPPAYQGPGDIVPPK